MGQEPRDRFEGYISVAERISKFYAAHPTGRVVTHIVEIDRESGFVLMQASVYRNADDAEPSATGFAYEVKGEGYVNKMSFVENCETGAIGRALANLGFETKRGDVARGSIVPDTTSGAGSARTVGGTRAEPRPHVGEMTVERKGKHFLVTAPRTDGGKGATVFHVGQKDDGTVTCTCLDSQRAQDKDFRCDHRKAVKQFLRAERWGERYERIQAEFKRIGYDAAGVAEYMKKNHPALPAFAQMAYEQLGEIADGMMLDEPETKAAGKQFRSVT